MVSSSLQKAKKKYEQTRHQIKFTKSTLIKEWFWEGGLPKESDIRHMSISTLF
jgi:hypothetical protein